MQQQQQLQQQLQHTTIGFHGNCPDGWIAAYIAFCQLQYTGPINLFAMSPNQKGTWPKKEQVAGTHVLLLDISVPLDTRQEWMAAGALSIQCIDHHASAVEHWPAEENPIDVSCCAAIQTWRRFHPHIDIPAWLHHVDRIDRWVNPTYEDRCVREILTRIAQAPVKGNYQDAFAMTHQYLFQIGTPQGFASIYAQGKEILEKKDAALLALLNRGSIHLVTDAHLAHWALPEHWDGAEIFLIDTSRVSLDTTEAAHLVFEHHPTIKVFINYRKKAGMKGAHDTYVYSARSRDFDLTSGSSILKGHRTSAGASFVTDASKVIPFISFPPA